MNTRLLAVTGTVCTWALALTCLPTASAFIQETEREIFATGDFNGDGHLDVVIVDKTSGKYRLGYQTTSNSCEWLDYRVSGLKGITGIALGRLLDPGRDAIVFTSADLNQMTDADAGPAGASAKAEVIPFGSLGPNQLIAIDIGGAGNTPLFDLYVNSIYNDPNPSKVAFLRNSAGKFESFYDADAHAQLGHANRLALKSGGTEFAAGLWTSDQGDTLRVEDVSSGKPVTVLEASGLEKGSDYLVGNFRGTPLLEFLIYRSGANSFQVRAVEETAGKFNLAAAKSFDLGKPIRQLYAVPGAGASQLLVIFGKGESAEVYKFDAASAPTSIQTMTPPQGDLLFGATSVEKWFLLFSGADYSKFSTHAYAYQFTGSTNTLGIYGRLASMADNDDATVPDVQKRIAETLKTESINSAADMKAYTNVIPGSQVTYVMIPIPGGEFTMGSPASEAGRQTDEGPQHKVKISPFWMGRCEVTWNEYELFMFPDDEKKLRELNPTPDYVNNVSDAVTRPSKPYMEMSFGMGKDGYPAISMTQHAANKYCHWLSAKTGHFYRLPTEAEWEYACRAGTTTAYSFGDDASKLGEYAWYEQNSDFKYQKIGKKRPNPWGLYDMHGNVSEWCLDQYVTNYASFTDALTQDPWTRATKPYPHAVRGGSYDDEAGKLRSAVRRASDKSWKMRDPQLPKSIWWLTDAQFVGLRLVRPLAVPPPDELRKCWTSGVEKE